MDDFMAVKQTRLTGHIVLMPALVK